MNKKLILITYLLMIITIILIEIYLKNYLKQKGIFNTI